MSIDCAKELHYLNVIKKSKMQHGWMFYYQCKNCGHTETKYLENKSYEIVISRC